MKDEQKNLPDPIELESKIWTAVDKIYRECLEQGYDQESASTTTALLTVKVGGFAMGLITKQSLLAVERALYVAQEMANIGILQGMGIIRARNGEETTVTGNLN